MQGKGGRTQAKAVEGADSPGAGARAAMRGGRLGYMRRSSLSSRTEEMKVWFGLSCQKYKGWGREVQLMPERSEGQQLQAENGVSAGKP